MWNYLFYIYSLKQKDETEFDGIESYIFSKIQPNREDISWFPIDKCIEIKE